VLFFAFVTPAFVRPQPFRLVGIALEPALWPDVQKVSRVSAAFGTPNEMVVVGGPLLMFVDVIH
jgi:hypothetical protein